MNSDHPVSLILRTSSLLASLSLGWAGCASTTTSPFSPFGDDADVYGEWDVQGVVPSESVCADAGIQEVGVVLFAHDSDLAFEDARLRAPCADGYLDTGDLRVLAAGTYEYQWRAYADGEPLLYSRRYLVTVEEGMEVVLQAVDLRPPEKSHGGRVLERDVPMLATRSTKLAPADASTKPAPDEAPSSLVRRSPPTLVQPDREWEVTAAKSERSGDAQFTLTKIPGPDEVREESVYPRR